MRIRDDDLDDRDWERPREARVRFDAIGAAWHLLLRHWLAWALTVLALALVNAGAVRFIYALFGVHGLSVEDFFRAPLPPSGRLVQVVTSMILAGFSLGGMFRMACRQVRGLPIGVETPFGVTNVGFELLFGSLLYGMATLAGFCCFVVPGFVASGLLMFTFPLIVDGGLPATAALRESVRALKNQWFAATLFHVVAYFVSGLGTCLCGIGILLSAPLYCLSIAILYRDFFLEKPSPSSPKPAPSFDDF